jgi:hypothetical protein
MFDTAAGPYAPFLIDPWAADYGSALDIADNEDEDEAGPPVDTSIETVDWSAGIAPGESARPEEIIFIDGVQRIDAWGWAPDGDRRVEAALASVGVGAVVSRADGSDFDLDDASRVLAVSGGVSATVLAAGELVYEPVSSPKRHWQGVNEAIAIRRREMEQDRAARMAAAHPSALIVLDGRLSEAVPRGDSVVGLAKSFRRLYLEPPHLDLLFRLPPGQRTPLFRIDFPDGSARYSWFLRLDPARPAHHPLVGLVRIEAPARIGDRRAVLLADLVTRHLPPFASRPEHDPRAPQNLQPVGALERQLRHQLGDGPWIRRIIEDSLYRGR